MPEKPTEPTPPFDVRAIRHLIRMMKRYDLTAIDLVEGATKIRLRRGNEPGPGAAAAFHGMVPMPVASAPQAMPAAPVRTEPAQAPAAASKDVVIESPMVGTYYASSAPDAPPFVSVGSVVRPDSTVCVIEAMKVFTDIPAGVTGTITEVLVKNGQSVEYGQPMFRVNPA
jgi:acetyl-CoA carboxylase biotin carboxyl carrier protein